MKPDDLPKRVIVDQHGHYWRDYGTHLSMCPVSEENTETEVYAVFERPYRRAENMLDEMLPSLNAVLASKASPPEYPGLALVPVADLEALQVAVEIAATVAAGARIDFLPGPHTPSDTASEPEPEDDAVDDEAIWVFGPARSPEPRKTDPEDGR